jgi:hypothetical protein
LALAAALPMLAQLAFNHATNGDPMLFGYAVAYPTLRYGFVESPWGTHTPFRGLEHTIRNLNALHLYLMAAPLPGLALAILGARDRMRDPIVWLFALPIVTALVIYAGFCFQDLTFGPRYMFEASLGLFPLAALGLREAIVAVGETERGTMGGWIAAAVIGALSVLPGLGVYYRSVYALDDQVVARAYEELPEGALVFVEGKYQRAFFAVDPDLGGAILFARDLGERNDELACAYPMRTAWLEREGRFLRLIPDCAGD